MVSQQDETLHNVHGLTGHREHFGHEVTVSLEESDRPQLDVEQKSRHPSERLQVFLSLIRCNSNQRLETLCLDCDLDSGRNEQISLLPVATTELLSRQCYYIHVLFPYL